MPAAGGGGATESEQMECKINVEERPLKTDPADKRGNTAVIHLTECGREVGLHINTTLSVEWFRKARLLFVLNVVLSALCLLTTAGFVLYYSSETAVLRDQLVAARPSDRDAMPLPPAALALHWPSQHDSHAVPKKYYVEDLERDLHFVSADRRDEDDGDVPAMLPDGLMVAHFVGADVEENLGQDPYVGPWMADYNTSSPNLQDYVQLLDKKLLKVRRPGLYLLYAQLMYVTNSARVFTLWAGRGGRTAESRLLATCASGDVTEPRPLRNAMLSCAVQTVVRLRAGDVLNFSQREKGTTVELRAGASYFGLVRLAS